MHTINSLISWIPDAWVPIIFLIKGGLAMIAAVTLVLTMERHWRCCYTTWPQQSRFIALLGYAVLVAGASAEQLGTDTALGYRHLGSLIMAAFLIYVCVVTLRADQKSCKKRS